MQNAFIAFVLQLGLCSIGFAQTTETKLPEGGGKQVTERVCSACHSIDSAVAERHDRDGWQKVVDDMVAKGADGTDAEFKTIVDYLSKYFASKTPQ